MAPGRGEACGGRGIAGTCVAAQAALCKATAGHRQLVLQLGGSADGPRLREERRRRRAEGSRRGGGPTQTPAAPCLEEEIEQVRATLGEMESRANIPLWTVEATQTAGGTAAPAAGVTWGGPHTGHCCRVL
ncbi:uncharacterized protein LOC104127964 [Egretta garzetta]|uniref:uncharacterized protein LOC104127964 n=1 Tax=Egretta garzetta TaxID=188379 RepID=UPI00163BBCE6|nr:uncharacterized protein LOC104127964 [Egretta garzetta]